MAQKELAPIKPCAVGSFLAWRAREADSVEMQKRRLKAQLMALAPDEAKFLAHYLLGDGLLDKGFAEFVFDGVAHCFRRDLSCEKLEQLANPARGLNEAWAGVVEVSFSRAEKKVAVRAIYPPPKPH